MNSSAITEIKAPTNTIISDLKQLTKVGLSLSVVFSSVAGYLLAVDIVSISTLLLLSLGGFFKSHKQIYKLKLLNVKLFYLFKGKSNFSFLFN